MPEAIFYQACQVRKNQTLPKIREALRSEILEEFSIWICKIPPLKPTTVRLMEELRVPECRPQRIKELVSQDPMLTAGLLRMANSAAAAQNHEVTSLEQAILYM